MKKRLFSLVTLLCILTTLWIPAVQAEAEFDKEALNGVVYIQTDIIFERSDEYGSELIPSDVNYRGSGFFVGTKGENPQYLITNYHVISDYVELKNEGSFFLTEDDGDYTYNASPSHLLVVFDQNAYEEAFVVDYDKTKDLAILRLDQPTDRRVPLTIADPKEDLVAQKVYALGYPALADDLMAALSSFSSSDLTVTSGVVSRVLTEQGTGVRQIQIDVPILGGNSGGPLINSDGCVVGITSSGAVDVESMNYAVSIEDLLPLLKKNSVVFEMAGQEEPGLDTTTWILIGVGGALLVLVIVLIVVLATRKGGSKKAAAQAAVPPVPQAPAAPAEPAKKPILRLMSPQHRGMVVPVTEQPVLIGRDVNACKVVFYDPAPGVSSHHCSVTWNAASMAFVVTDVGSTYGTYLANGQRMSSGVTYSLRPGDSFYVGDRTNVIRVELG